MTYLLLAILAIAIFRAVIYFKTANEIKKNEQMIERMIKEFQETGR